MLTIQTFSFHGELSPLAQHVQNAYHQRFGTRRTEEILAPVGVAHGYDGMLLLAEAVNQAGSTDGPKVREALEQLPPVQGLVKRYAPAFSGDRHDALGADDYLMTVWRDGRLVPAPVRR